MPSIAIKNLSISYQNKKVTNTVIDNLSVNFPNGKISVIIGASGCGKTTLLRAIAGLSLIDNGEILFDDVVGD